MLEVVARVCSVCIMNATSCGLSLQGMIHGSPGMLNGLAWTMTVGSQAAKYV